MANGQRGSIITDGRTLSVQATTNRCDDGGYYTYDLSGNMRSDTLNEYLYDAGAMTGANGVVTTVKTVWQWNLQKKAWDMITAVPAR